jgi:hypothetical protein
MSFIRREELYREWLILPNPAAIDFGTASLQGDAKNSLLM